MTQGPEQSLKYIPQKNEYGALVVWERKWGDWSAWSKTRPSAMFSITNPAGKDAESKPSLRV